jgi:hypothetical protein
MSDDIKPETLDFIFDYTRDAPERQLQDAKDLDNKMAQLFSVASVVIGLAGLANSIRAVDGQFGFSSSH